MSVLRRAAAALCLLTASAVASTAAAQADDARRDRGRGGDAPKRGAEAAPRGEPRQAPRQRQQEDPLADSVREVQRSNRGQVLSAERVPYDGRHINRIKVVDDRGRVRVYMDDPQSRRPPPPRTRGDDD